MTSKYKYQIANDGAPVVALHSSASGSTQWLSLQALLQDRFDVIALDLPGYDLARPRDDAFADMSSLACPIIADIEGMAFPVHLVGHSFGGAVALKIALLRPELVKSLTLYEPVAFHLLNCGEQSEQWSLTGVQTVEQTLNTAMAAGCDEFGMAEFIDFWQGTGTWQGLQPALREKLVAAAPMVSSDFRCIYGETWTLDDLAGLQIPTLIMMGMDSPEVSQRLATMIALNLPGAEFAMLPGLGHMAPINAPEWVNPRIHQHIARIETSVAHVRWPVRRAA